MKQICPFNKDTDIPFEPKLAVDLAEVLDKGIVPATGTAVDFNNITDPENISGSARDVFAVMDAERSLRKRAAAAATPVSGSQPANGSPSE